MDFESIENFENMDFESAENLENVDFESIENFQPVIRRAPPVHLRTKEMIDALPVSTMTVAPDDRDQEYWLTPDALLEASYAGARINFYGQRPPKPAADEHNSHLDIGHYELTPLEREDRAKVRKVFDTVKGTLFDLNLGYSPTTDEEHRLRSLMWNSLLRVDAPGSSLVSEPVLQMPFDFEDERTFRHVDMEGICPRKYFQASTMLVGLKLSQSSAPSFHGVRRDWGALHREAVLNGGARAYANAVGDPWLYSKPVPAGKKLSLEDIPTCPELKFSTRRIPRTSSARPRRFVKPPPGFKISHYDAIATVWPSSGSRSARRRLFD